MGTPGIMAQDLSGDELDMLRQKVAGWQTYKVGREVVKKVGDDKVGSTTQCAALAWATP